MIPIPREANKHCILHDLFTEVSIAEHFFGSPQVFSLSLFFF